eukprot:1159913-Prorocentrum_minimum.AAC.6
MAQHTALPPQEMLTSDSALEEGAGAATGVTYTRLSSVVPFDRVEYRRNGRMCLKGVHPTTKAALAMMQRCVRDYASLACCGGVCVMKAAQAVMQ